MPGEQAPALLQFWRGGGRQLHVGQNGIVDGGVGIGKGDIIRCRSGISDDCGLIGFKSNARHFGRDIREWSRGNGFGVI